MGKKEKAKAKRKNAAKHFIKLIESKYDSGNIVLTIHTHRCLAFEKILRFLAFDGCGPVSAKEVISSDREHAALHHYSVISKEVVHYHLAFENDKDVGLFLKGLLKFQQSKAFQRTVRNLNYMRSVNPFSLYAAAKDDSGCTEIASMVDPETVSRDGLIPNSLLSTETGEVAACMLQQGFVNFLLPLILLVVLLLELFRECKKPREQANDRPEEGRRLGAG